MDLAEGTHKLRSTIFCLYDCRLNNNNRPVNVVDIQIILIFFHIRGTELSNRAKCLFFDLIINNTRNGLIFIRVAYKPLSNLPTIYTCMKPF